MISKKLVAVFISIGAIASGLLHRDSFGSSPPDEMIIAVKLYDSNGPPAKSSTTTLSLRQTRNLSKNNYKKKPPRYSIGMLHVPNKRNTFDKANFIMNSELNSSPDPFHYFTFDLGNPGNSILLVQDCLACTPPQRMLQKESYNSDLGCPPSVPLCNDPTTDSQCWISHPNQFIPSSSFGYIFQSDGGLSCPQKNGNSTDAGSLIPDVEVCIACFDGGDHSRFYSYAKMDLSLLNYTNTDIQTNNSSHDITIKDFNFGALVRTVPQKNRIWSNIGLGANSGFLQQLQSCKSFMFLFNYYSSDHHNNKLLDIDLQGDYEQEFIIFHPNRNRYSHWPKAPFIIDHHRHHIIQSIYFLNDGGKDAQEQRKLHQAINNTMRPSSFIMDTGNSGISIHKDDPLMEYLSISTNGSWKDQEDASVKVESYGDKRLYVPYSPQDAPTLVIELQPKNGSDEEGIKVFLPNYVWVFDDGSDEQKKHATIFVTDGTYNILGLPFLTAPDYSYVFNDEEQMLYIGRGEMQISTSS